ncbi:MAG: TIGR00341 family protein [Haloferacaceae archaeon]
MRVVQITIPSGKQQAVLEVLEEGGIDYVLTDETSNREFTSVVTFPLPKAGVEPVLEELRAVGIDESTYTVIVSAETVISRRFEELSEKYAEEGEHEGELIAREELTTKAEELVRSTPLYATMTVVSAVIATAGLLLDSPATVVGSMVIAPLIGPAMSASVGTVVDDPDLFRRGVRLQGLGIFLSIAASAAFAGFLRAANLVPPGLDPLQLAEVAERVAPNVLALAVALGAGVAGILSLTTGVSSALVGVMIAVALIPPAATAGLGIAYLDPWLAFGSGVLVFVNVLSINFAALLVLWYQGYRPENWFRADRARSALVKRAAMLAVAIALLSVFLGGVTYDTYVAATTEQEIRAGVTDELAAVDDSLSLVELEVERTGTIPPLETERVLITVGYPPGDPPAPLAERLGARIQSTAGEEVIVEVRYVQREMT